METAVTPASPLVSVVMPAYNSERYIAKAMQSVLSQTFSDLELIVVDDGSTDGTTKIVQGVAEQDRRVRLVCQPNSGRPSIARNAGIVVAKGKYLSFLDSDDYWLPNRLKLLIHAMNEHPEWIAVFHDLKFVDADENDLGGTYLSNAMFLSVARDWIEQLEGGLWNCNERFFIFMSLRFAAVHTQSILINRTKLKPDGLMFDPTYIICEDTDLWIRIAMFGHLGYLNKVLSCYRQHGTSITRQRALLASQAVTFHSANLARVASHMTPEERGQYELKLADHWRDLGYLSYRASDFRKSRQAYLKAFLLSCNVRDITSLCKTFIPSTLLDLVRKHLAARVRTK